MLFARAVGDPNPVYSDAEYAATAPTHGVIAPPTFVAAAAQFNPDWALRPKPGEPWKGSGREATGRKSEPGVKSETSVRLHAEQHFEYHVPLRPGDVLTPTERTGKTWTKEGRSGKLVFSEAITDYRDADGTLMVTARAVVVFTERPAAEET
jgi:acyl dehydratase